MTTIKPAIALAGLAAVASRVEEILRRTDAIRPDGSVDPARLLADAAVVDELAEHIAGRWVGSDVTVAIAGCRAAAALAAAVDARLWPWRSGDARRSRPASLATRADTLIVDVAHAPGGELEDAADRAEAAGRHVAGCAVIVELGSGVATVASASGRRRPLTWLCRLEGS